ncbi:hypothetical protein KIPB_006504 [Kipferlia bialata]|uniref:HECT-type E3 ubiquitin transferase n=1 Tax=Kipferlia bialata TaxID=797122 RepID=A0A9K3CYQ0_9EUKA|nr:hypothetical protein KIPB_006504 [Kipferlia bialata]|eukprot:g6504.t1
MGPSQSHAFTAPRSTASLPWLCLCPLLASLPIAIGIAAHEEARRRLDRVSKALQAFNKRDQRRIIKAIGPETCLDMVELKHKGEEDLENAIPLSENDALLMCRWLAIRDAPKLRHPVPPLILHQARILADTLAEFSRATYKSLLALRSPLRVRFLADYTVVDMGGVHKEFLTSVTAALMSITPELLETTQGQTAMTVSPMPTILAEALGGQLRLLGFCTAKAFVERVPIGICLSTPLLAILVGRPLTIDILAAQDSVMAHSLGAIQDMSADDLECMDLTMSAETPRGVVVPLGQHSVDTPVTTSNVQEYVQLMIKHHLTFGREHGIREMTVGFRMGCDHHVVNRIVSLGLPLATIQAAIRGASTLDVDDWREHTSYQGFEATDEQVVWFWEWLSSSSQETRRSLLMFVTGMWTVPRDGFASLQSAFTIRMSYHSTDHLPVAHVCFNWLDLPRYESKEALQTALQTALTHKEDGLTRA